MTQRTTNANTPSSSWWNKRTKGSTWLAYYKKPSRQDGERMYEKQSKNIVTRLATHMRKIMRKTRVSLVIDGGSWSFSFTKNRKNRIHSFINPQSFLHQSLSIQDTNSCIHNIVNPATTSIINQSIILGFIHTKDSKQLETQHHTSFIKFCSFTDIIINQSSILIHKTLIFKSSVCEECFCFVLSVWDEKGILFGKKNLNV